MSTQIESMRSGLIAVKSLLSRDPCVHANTAIQMIDAMLAELDHPEQMARLGWQYVECPACGSEGARAFPKPEGQPVAWMDKYGEIYKDVPEVLLTDTPLYTSPPAQRTWAGLTEEQSIVIWSNSQSVDEAIRATEKQLKENNK